MQFKTLALAALASLASAQRTWVVTVAQNGNFTFSPDNIKAAPGEFVQFQFLAGNHTVTQSTFDKPCQPIAMHSNATGFHSGFQPVAASASMGMIPTYTIQVNNTNPLWLYCAQGRHCENGMAMVINEPATNPNRTLANYKALAAQAQTILPGGATGGQPGSVDTPTPSGGNTTPGSETAPGTETSDAPTPSVTAGAGMLAAPGTFVLVAAGAVALLL
ncbi:Cupredoxin [Triangularia verruculosa]|uniref:Cupredoxin n=1 Tax=Triangularia verruculosa TaxID=2587418 RepID=A0AAN6XFZ6_9PEZI|nr:Cupredoxin [Triangularia verruculosa]